MGKYVRIFIALFMFLGLVWLARNNVAWAATEDQPSEVQAGLSASLDTDDDCDKVGNKDKDKCKDKEKCKKGDNCGSVKPPPDSIKICEPGLYSIGGISTLDVKRLRDHDKEPD